MKVLCPYIEIDPATEFCLRFQVDRRVLDVQFIELNPDLAFDYWRTLREAWGKKEGFIVVEGDVIPWPGALEELAYCHHRFCTFWAPSGWNQDHYALGYGIGCTKFSSELIHAHPLLLEHPCYWHELDGRILDGLTRNEEEIHFHGPPVTHISESRYPQ